MVSSQHTAPLPNPIVRTGILKAPKDPTGQQMARRQIPNWLQQQNHWSNWICHLQLTQLWPLVSRCSSPLVGNAGSNFNPPQLFPNHYLPKSSRRERGREGRRFSSVRAGARPWRRTPFSPLSPVSPSGCQAGSRATPGSDSEGSGWLAMGSPVGCPLGTPSSKTRRLQHDKILGVARALLPR